VNQKIAARRCAGSQTAKRDSRQEPDGGPEEREASGRKLPPVQEPFSSRGSFLWRGFLRDLGSMGRAAGTVPTRSRANLRTTFFASSLVAFLIDYSTLNCCFVSYV
jgi:hypothetical protein